jgi:hypothetical protein
MRVSEFDREANLDPLAYSCEVTMSHGIARLEMVVRAFPVPNENPYKAARSAQDAGPEQQAARQLLELARRRPPLWRRVRTLGSGPEAVSRLLWLHRRALEAEIRGDWPAADFWWGESEEQWSRLPPAADAWAELTGCSGGDGAALAADGPALRARLARELLLDTHLALFNGLMKNNPRDPSPRARWHLDRARALAAEAGLSGQEAADLDAQPDLQRIGAHLDHHESTEAIEAAAKLVERLPDVPAYRALLIRLHREDYEATAANGEWIRAAEHLEWLTEHDASRRPRWRRDGAAFLYTAAQKSWDSEDWDAAALCGQSLTAWFPEREDYQAFARQAAHKADVKRLARTNRRAAFELVLRRARENPDSLDDVEQYPSRRLQAANAALGNPSDEAGNLREAEMLEEHIKALEEYLKEFPECTPCYDALGVLHQVRAVRLTNGGRPSQGLLAIAQAMAYRPEADELRQVEASIAEQLNSLQREVRKLPALDRRNPAAAFHLLRIQLYLDEATRGAGPRDAFRNAQTPKSIALARRYSGARRFWLRFGLPRLRDRDDWDRRALALDEATDRLLASRPQNAIELLTTWDEIVKQTPGRHLEDIEPARLLEFFVHKPKSGIPEIGPPELGPEVADEGEPEAEAPPLDAAGRQVYRLEARTPSPHAQEAPPRVPLDFWLFSGRDPGRKLAAAAALAIATGATFLVIPDGRDRAERAAAYAELKADAATLDDAAARAAIGRFRAARPLASRDTREAQVARLESDLGRWPDLRRRNQAFDRMAAAVNAADDVKAAEAAREFQAVPAGEPADPRAAEVAKVLEWTEAMRARRQNDEAYRRLAECRGRSDYLGALRAAEAFLEADPKREADPRTPRVLAWYGDAFADWMVRRRAGALDGEARARVEKYGSLAARSAQGDNRP